MWLVEFHEKLWTEKIFGIRVTDLLMLLSLPGSWRVGEKGWRPWWQHVDQGGHLPTQEFLIIEDLKSKKIASKNIYYIWQKKAVYNIYYVSEINNEVSANAKKNNITFLVEKRCANFVKLLKFLSFVTKGKMIFKGLPTKV